MIPPKIHYCWFGGGELPAQAKKCISSWEKFCPDYEIIQWNEQNFDVAKYPYAAYCLAQKKWAFLSDFVRLVVVKEYGGIYLDTDVEVIKPLDSLLGYQAFYGFENSEKVATGLGFGAEAGHPTVDAMFEAYMGLQADANGAYPLVVCPALNTQALLPFGLRQDGTRQSIAGAEILPADFLNPYDDPTGRLLKTNNTVSIHWYSKSWMSKGTILRSKLTKPFHRIFGEDCFAWLKRRF